MEDVPRVDHLAFEPDKLEQMDQLPERGGDACDLTLSLLNYQLVNMERGSELETCSGCGSSIEFDVFDESSGLENDQDEKNPGVNLDLTINCLS